MGRGAIYSACLHLAIVLIALFGLPWLFDTDEIIEATPVSIVSADQLNDLMREAMARPKPPEVKPPEPPKPPKPEEVKIPEPPAPVPEPEPESEPLPEPEVVEEIPVPEPVIAEPEPLPEPLPVEQPQKVAVAKPTPPQKPKPPKKDKKKPEDKPKEEASDSMSALLNKLNTQQATAQPQPVQEADVAEESQIVERLSASEEDAIRRQFVPCWSVDTGKAGVEEMVVEITARYNPDGTVVTADFTNPVQVATGGALYQSFAESARRAVLNPLCNPIQIPKSKPYSAWKTITFAFSPRDML